MGGFVRALTENTAIPTTVPRILFLGLGYAGHNTRFQNLRAHSQLDPRMRPTYRLVSGWEEGGMIERLPGVPAALKGRARAVLQGAPLACLPRPDAIWLAPGEAVSPFLWSQFGPLRRPLIKDLDATFDQLNELAPLYFGRAPKRGLRLWIGRLLEKLLWQSVSLFTPWSNWAAAGLRARGIPEERIRVLPPGVDLDYWRTRAELRSQRSQSDPMRLLFVGGDFVRKGGPMLLDVLRTRFRQRFILDVVTREPVHASPNVRVWRLEAADQRLRTLYAQADLFVMPSRAECFGLATVEAFASGLPAIVSDLGGARDIVDTERTGWLIPPTSEGLADALDKALAARATLPAMGVEARRVAEARFDGARNDALLVDLLIDQARRSHPA